MHLVRADGERAMLGERRAVAALRAGCACLALLSALAAPAKAEPPAPGTGPSSRMRVDTVHVEASRPTILSVHPDLLARLHVLAEGLHKEIVLCLHGDVIGDTARLTRLTMPDPHRSDTGSARFGPCPADALAAWHNHPVPPPGIRSPRAVIERGAPGPCRLSETDVLTAARAGLPFTIVSVDAPALCSWTLQEVRDLARRQSSITASLQVY